MLVKVRCNAAQRRELHDLATIFHGTVCDVSLNTITLEMQGKEKKMHALQGLLAPYGASCRTPLAITWDLCIGYRDVQGPHWLLLQISLHKELSIIDRAVND